MTTPSGPRDSVVKVRPRRALAVVLAAVYHGQPVNEAFVFGAATGGKVFVDQATAVLTRLRELGAFNIEFLRGGISHECRSTRTLE
jgi:hypothetical protein